MSKRGASIINAGGGESVTVIPPGLAGGRLAIMASDGPVYLDRVEALKLIDVLVLAVNAWPSRDPIGDLARICAREIGRSIHAL